MQPIRPARERLIQLGYLFGDMHSASDISTAVIRFQSNHGDLFLQAVEGHYGAAASVGDQWGPVCQKLLDAPRDCSCPDIARNKDGNEIAEARWPENCALELEFSCNFLDRGMPGLTSAQTKNCILFALAQLNTMFELTPDGTIQDVVMSEFMRLGGDPEVDIFVLAVGTITHEIMHAMGGRHTPSDPESVLFPSMRGQYLLNKTDIRNFTRLGYSKTKPLRLKLVEWQGDDETHVWARLGALPGSTLAWSMLASGTCRQRAEQRYDSTVTWNKTRINLPPTTPPVLPVPPTPEEPKVLHEWTADYAGQKFQLVTGKSNGGVIEI